MKKLKSRHSISYDKLMWNKIVRRVRKFWQRGRRGWSDEDVWSLDHYINRVTGEALLHLANTTHGYQPEFDDLESWQAHLCSMANDMLAWNDDMFCERGSFDKAHRAWEEWHKHFGGFWD